MVTTRQCRPVPAELPGFDLEGRLFRGGSPSCLSYQASTCTALSLLGAAVVMQGFLTALVSSLPADAAADHILSCTGPCLRKLMLRSLSILVQTLSLGNCGLRVFPQSLTALTNLVWCDLSHNYAMVRTSSTVVWITSHAATC